MVLHATYAKCGLLGVLLMMDYWGLAQESSVALRPISVFGMATEKYSVGAKIQHTDSLLLAQFRFATLAELLSASTPLAFKSYGNGRLTTVSFRGTSANHTAILWNGININQPTLGQTDFSTIPVTSVDQLAIHYGSASSNYGSDAIGGSIHLASVPTWQSKLSMTIGQQFASFGNSATTAYLRCGGGTLATSAWESKTRIYWQNQPNQYPYDSLGGHVLGLAQTRRRGAIQDWYWRNTKGQVWSLHGWWHDNYTHIEPHSDDTHQHDKNIRLLVNLQSGSLLAKVGFIHDFIRFQDSYARTSRWFTRSEYEWILGEKDTTFTSLRAGLEGNHYTAQVDGYGGKTVSEIRADGYVMFRHRFHKRLHTSCNIRQAFIQGFKPPITPSIGVDWQWLKLRKSQYSLRSTVARSYHVPTLNERHWIPQGNPDIQPEKGWSQEVSLTYQTTIKPTQSFKFEFTTYRKHIKNWILWNPAHQYKAENIQEVLSTGLEAIMIYKCQLTERSFDFSIHYSYTRCRYMQINSLYDSDIAGKQLMYVPLHTGVLNMIYRWKLFSLQLQTQGNSWRYTTADNTKYIPGYGLLTLQTTRKIQFKNESFHVSLQANNLTNTLYLNVENKAMPGRNFALNFLYQL